MSWNRPSGEADYSSLQKRKNASNSKQTLVRFSARGFIAGTLVILGVAGIYFTFHSPTPTTDHYSPSAQPKRIRQVTPAAAKPTEFAVATNTERAKTLKIPRNPDGSIDWTKIKPHELPPEMIGQDPKPKDPKPPIFSNSADQVIAMVISTPPDQEVPPLVGLGDDLEVQFFKSFESPVMVYADDPESVKALKQSLIETKKQILQLIDAGKTVTQIIEDHLEVFNENRKTYADSQKAVNEYIEDGDIESAKAYIEKANPILESMGAPLLKMPMTKEERRAERRAHRKARKALQGAPNNKFH